jgi:glutamate racemase
MEPAVKPAAERSETRKVAVLATPATFQGALFASVVDRFADGVEVLEIIVPGLVELIEGGQTASEEIDSVLLAALEPARSHGIDTLVLACTHYSFVISAINRILGPKVSVIDPAPAVARQTQRLWEGQGFEENSPGSTDIRYITSGDPGAFRSWMLKLVGDVEDAEPASWEAGSLIATS